MICKKCGETFSEKYKACPNCGERKNQKKMAEKTFKVDLPEDMNSQIDNDKAVKNKVKSTKYISSDVYQKDTASNKTLEKKKVAVKPATTQELFSKVLSNKKSAANKDFKIALPQEYAELNLKVETSQSIKNEDETDKDPIVETVIQETKEEITDEAETKIQETNLDSVQDEIKTNEALDEIAEVSSENKIQAEIQRREREFELAIQSQNEEEKRRLKIVPKKAMNTVVALVMSLVIILGSLSVISAITSWFEMSDEIVKSLSFISVKDEKIQEIEEFLNKIISVLIVEDFDSSIISANEVLDLIKPYSESGVYANFFSQASLIYDNADPASRFIEEGEGYYCIAQEEIDQIFAYLGVQSISMAMQEQYYLYDGYYYFSQAPEDYVQNQYELTVLSVKSTLDNCYYVELSVKDLTTSAVYERYAIISKEETDEETTYFLDTISQEALFNSFGEMRVISTDETSLYSMQREVIELETSDGLVLYEYVIDYPVLSGDSNTIVLINQLYSDLIASYKLSSEEVDSEYEIYKAAGVSEDIYPISVYIDVSVQLYDEENIAILQRVIEENSLIEAQDDIIVPLYETSISSLNYVIESTHDMKIAEVIGDNEDEISEILYRMYYSYDYSTVLTGEYLDQPSWYYYGWEEDYDSTPSDSEKIGDDIYDSCFALTAAGVIFYYENEYGYYQEFFISYETIETINSVYAVDETIE